jgi:hypothetical protein
VFARDRMEGIGVTEGEGTVLSEEEESVADEEEEEEEEEDLQAKVSEPYSHS